MKLCGLICRIVTAAVVAANIPVISMTAAYSETTDTDMVYREDFESFENKNYSPTLTALKNQGWYAADRNTLYTEIGSFPPYSTYSGEFAKIDTVDNSKVLSVVSAGEGDNTQNADVPKYGYAKTFPGVPAGKAVTGSWEISFDFKPYLFNKMTQFAFTLNTGDLSDRSEKAAEHNIIAGYGQRFYLGYRDYNELLNSGVKQAALKAADIGGVTWYTVKTILNCDERYYSVELYNRATGALIARRSPVSFDAHESVGFLKFSALGFKQKSRVYIDNISIEKTEKDKTVYNETFDTFTSGSYLAADGMTTGTANEDLTGDSYFEGYTPWRFHEDIGNSYVIENDSALLSKAVRLGDDPVTQDRAEASGLIYMQAGEPLLTQTTAPLRGMLKTAFKIKPEAVVNDVTVNVISDAGQDITADECAFFRITNNGGAPAFEKGGGEYVPLNASGWYSVEQIYDAAGRKVTTALTDPEGNSIAAGVITGDPAPYAVSAVMFRADGGSSVLVDDISFEYCMDAPSVNKSGIVLTDRFGEEISDISNVTTALKTIEIPVGCTVDEKTADPSTVLLTDSNGNEIPYTGSVSGNSYIMELCGALSLNEEYTVTIPQTLANTYGDELGTEVTFTFGTLNMPADISAVSVNGEPLYSLPDITAGSTVDVSVSVAGGTDADANGTVILAFYGDDKLVYMSSADTDERPETDDTGEITASFTVPEDMDMSAVDNMSVFVWDGSEHMRPLALRTDITNKGEAAQYKEYVDFTVNVESGREAVILQLTDTQIVDSTQIRPDVTYNPAMPKYWMPQLMNQRLFNDLREIIAEVKPDLILLTGDMVYGGYDDAGTSFTTLADFLDRYGIPWAPVFGNHENESKMGVDWQCEYLENCENCLFRQRTLTGNGNYSIGIVQGGELKRVIFMLDSNGCAVMSDESFANGHSKKTAGFGDDQIEWYTAAAEKINNDFENMRYTFAFHIQLAAFEDAFNSAYGFVNGGERKENGDLVSPINIDERADKKDTDFGYIGRNLKGPWDKDRSVYNGIKAIGADSVLVGHEHCNSASVVYDGIRFQYGQKIGEYDRINFKSSDGTIVGASAYASDAGTPILGGTVMKLSEQTGEISDAYIYYCSK